MAEKKTYTITVTCSNCDFEGDIEIRKGTEASGVHECPNCECMTAIKKRSYVSSAPSWVAHTLPFKPSVIEDYPSVDPNPWPYPDGPYPRIWCGHDGISSNHSY